MMIYEKRLFKLVLATLMAWTLGAATAPVDAALVKDIRIKPMPASTEIVMDLDSAPQNLKIHQGNPKQAAIQFSGQLDTALKSTSHPVPEDPNLSSVYMEDQDGKVQLFIKGRDVSAIRVYPLENPDRVVIRVDKPTKTPPPGSHVVAPGVIHRRLHKTIGRGRISINVLEVDLKHPEVTIEPVMAASHLHGKAKVSDLVSRYGAVAGINASFFKPDTGTALGTLIVNKELLAGPIYDRVCLGITTDKSLRMARLSLRGKLITDDAGHYLPIHNVNQPRLNKHQFILYSSRWGHLAPPTPVSGIQVRIEGDRVTAVSKERQHIPRDGYVLVGPDQGLDRILAPGKQVAVQVYTVPDWSNVESAISGGPYLLKNGQIYVDMQAESFRHSVYNRPAPRTAVGITANNRLLMVTVDGRQKPVSVGVTLYEMARLMKELGAVDAMNLDGGSSTQMIVKGRVVNSPTVAGGARVSNALVVRHTPQPPSEPAEMIGATSDDPTTNTRF